MEIPAGEFKAKCLQIMDQVGRTHRAVVITKRGRPVARLLPPEAPEAPRALFGYLAGAVTILGDIVNVPHEPWAAETGGEDRLYRSKGAKAGKPKGSGSRTR